MEKHFCASAFVVDPTNKKILLCYHKKFQKWVQPGGHIEKEEVPEDTALREVYEETGVKIKLIGERFPREEDFIKPLGIQKNRGKDGTMHIDIIYVGIPLSQDIVDDDEEIERCSWFTLNELENINVFQDIKITFNYILNNIIK